MTTKPSAPGAPAQPQTGLDRPLIESLAADYGMNPGHFSAVIRKTIMPSAATDEQVHAFLLVCKTYRLNPVLRLIHAFPSKSGGIVPVVGIDGWLSIINSQPEFDGLDVKVIAGQNGKPESATCTIYRKDRKFPTIVTEYYDECKRDTEPWKGMPARMLRHKAIIQCARVAFALGGIFDEDEGRDIANATPAHPAPNSILLEAEPIRQDGSGENQYGASVAADSAIPNESTQNPDADPPSDPAPSTKPSRQTVQGQRLAF